MLTLRPARWPEDCDSVAALDTGFRTDRIYTLERDALSVRLNETRLDRWLEKRYTIDPRDADERRSWHHAAIAEKNGTPVGFVAVEFSEWTRRAIVWHLYVASGWRRSGVGRMLLADAEAFARRAGARCLWVETQNVNYPAIRFYLRSGFRFCGCDESLYDPVLYRGEIAVFFDRPVSDPES